MAKWYQVPGNVLKYGFRGAIRGALQTPGGYLDSTEKNPYNAYAISHPSKPDSRLAGQNYYNTATKTYKQFPVQTAPLSPSAPKPTPQPKWQQLGYPSEDAWLSANASGYNGQYSGYADYLYNAATKPATTSTSGATAASTSPTIPQYTWWMGTQYDWNNPEQRDAYAQAKKSWLDTTYANAFNKNQGIYNQNMADLKTNTMDLRKAWEARNANIGSYYSAVAPDMYQSAEGQNLQESQNMFDKSAEQVAREKNNVNNWWTDYQNQWNTNKAQDVAAINQMLDNAASQDYANKVQAGVAGGYTRPDYVTSGITGGMSKFNSPTSPISPADQSAQGKEITGLAYKIMNGLQLTPEELQIAQEWGIA